MKLASIAHERCQEVDAMTYCWIPDDWDSFEFQKVVNQAKADYWDKLKFHNPDPPNDYKQYISFPEYDKYPDKTVKEVKDEWQAKKEAFLTWKSENDLLTKPFALFLQDYGIKPFYDYDDEVMTAEIDWGHNHGTKIEYSATDPSPSNMDIAPRPIESDDKD